MRREVTTNINPTRNFKHGRIATPEYRSWTPMKKRCLDPANIGWKRYGGRGITIHPQWMEFAPFFADMGPRPPGTTLDRINNDGNYEPGNCRWATPKVQANNRRKVKRVI